MKGRAVWPHIADREEAERLLNALDAMLRPIEKTVLMEMWGNTLVGFKTVPILTPTCVDCKWTFETTNPTARRCSVCRDAANRVQYLAWIEEQPPERRERLIAEDAASRFAHAEHLAKYGADWEVAADRIAPPASALAPREEVSE